MSTSTVSQIAYSTPLNLSNSYGTASISVTDTNNDSLLVGVYCQGTNGVVIMDCGYIPSSSQTGSFFYTIPSFPAANYFPATAALTPYWGLYIKCNNWVQDCVFSVNAAINVFSLLPAANAWVFDPRSNASNFCYASAPVLNQGQCGSCYSFAIATAYSISACKQAYEEKVYAQLSPQDILNNVGGHQDSWTSSSTTTKNPCSGGFAGKVLTDYRTYLTSTSATPLSCSPDGNDNSCSAGCLPYGEQNCSISCNAPITSAASCSSGQWGAHTCCCSTYTQNTCSPNTSTAFVSVNTYQWSPTPIYPVPPSTQEDTCLVINNKKVSTTVDFVKNYLQGQGPLSVTAYVSCNDWSNYFFSYRNWYGGAMTAFSGNGCSYMPNHALALIGWTQCTNGECWIIQNSWATNGGDNGFIYALIAAQGTGGPGDMSLSNPVGISFTKNPGGPNLIIGGTSMVNSADAASCVYNTPLPIAPSNNNAAVNNVSTVTAPGAPVEVRVDDEQVLAALQHYKEASNVADDLQIVHATHQVVNGYLHTVTAHTANSMQHVFAVHSTRDEAGNAVMQVTNAAVGPVSPSSSSSSAAIIGGVVGGTVGLLLVLVIVVLMIRHRRRRNLNANMNTAPINDALLLAS